jgi:hypothetical protein
MHRAAVAAAVHQATIFRGVSHLLLIAARPCLAAETLQALKAALPGSAPGKLSFQS